MTATSSGLGARRLRANPGYELVLLDRLDEAERAWVERQAGEEDLYGVLRPRPGTGLDPRTASADVALLFMTLTPAAALPRYVRARLGDDAERTAGRLVLDGVLEAEAEAGRFVSGAEAAALLGPVPSPAGRGRVGELSLSALRYAQELTDIPHEALVGRLYGYGTSPLSPQLRTRLRDEAAVAAAWGLTPGGPAHAALAAGWVELPDQGDGEHWRHWRSRSAGATAAPPAGDGAGYKLYVSPRLDALPEALAAVATALAQSPGPTAFKLGRDVRGVCRPDKLVAYFDRLDDLHVAAARLRSRLNGCPAQGVPFTAAITDDGLLSWGADPPPALTSGRTSWRLWLADRLAEHLVHAARTGAGLDDDLPPWQYALQRLRLAGVETDSWIPAREAWPDVLARQ